MLAVGRGVSAPVREVREDAGLLRYMNRLYIVCMG